MSFKKFLAKDTQYNNELNTTLGKIPKAHRTLLKGYKFKFEGGNTLDGNHVGSIDEEKKEIIIGSPWNYGREYAVLHEIGHIVWKYLLTSDLEKEWTHIVNSTKEKQDQNAEELFCMAYATTYAKNKVSIHDHSKWDKFVKKMPK